MRRRWDADPVGVTCRKDIVTRECRHLGQDQDPVLNHNLVNVVIVGSIVFGSFIGYSSLGLGIAVPRYRLTSSGFPPFILHTEGGPFHDPKEAVAGWFYSY